jgi:Thioesterase-like superfamily
MAAVARTMCLQTNEQGSPHTDPITVTTHYLRPGAPGPADVRAEILRTGRTFTTATAGHHQGEPTTLREEARALRTRSARHLTLREEARALRTRSARHLTLRTQTMATFGTLGDPKNPDYLTLAPPDIPSPEACVSRAEATMFVNHSSINDSTEIRLHPDTGWMNGQPSGTAQSIGWIRLRDGREPDPWALLYFADALPPTVFEILPDRAWVPTIEMTVHVRAKPAPGWILARMTCRHVADGRFEEDGELWDSTGRLVAQSRQLAMILPT